MPDDNQEQKPLPQYRRDLNAKPRISDDTANNAQSSDLPMMISNFMPLIIFVAVIICIYAIYDFKTSMQESSLQKQLAADQQQNRYIRIASIPGIPATNQMMALLDIYGFKSMVVKPVGDTMQIILPDGKVMDTYEFIDVVTKLPVKNFHPGYDYDSVILYGVAGCPYAMKAQQMLNAKGIKYEYVDLNDRANPAMNTFDARILASGFSPREGTRNPYLEYHHKIFQNPDLYNVISQIK